MMADDIASNTLNPYPGNIINVPHGRNVYPSVPKDYTGGEANKDNLKNVLLGEPQLQSLRNSKSSGKFLNSTKNDNVFIYYADHGAKGLIQMPYGDPLWADELLKILREMKERGKFKSLVFYVEACESGSMFENLLNAELGVYAMTAASPNEPSYAYYYDEERNVWLADEFSVSWMVDSEANMTAPFETIRKQFQTTKSRTTESSVQQYGNFYLSTAEVGEFQGVEDEIRTIPSKKFIQADRGIPQWDARLEGLKRRLSAEKHAVARAEIQREIDQEILERHQTEYVFKIIVSYTVRDSSYNNSFEYWRNLNLQPRNFPALRFAWDYASHKCVTWNAYALQFWGLLVSLCETVGEDALARGMKMACD